MNSKQCSCGKCECDLNSAREQETETLRVHDILSGLDDATHEIVRSQVCAMYPFPDLDSVYQTVSQNEIIRSTVVHNTPVMGFTSQARSSNNSPRPIGNRETFRPVNKDPSRQCLVCGRTRHEASGCFTVIGYPDWWDERSRNRNTNWNTQTKPTENGKGITPKANTATVTKTNTSKIHANVTITEADRLGLSGIIVEQWSIVHKLINK